MAVASIKIVETPMGLSMLIREGSEEYRTLMHFTSWEAVNHFALLLTKMYNDRAELPACVVRFMEELYGHTRD